MVITQIYRVSFNPVTEWNQIIKFRMENPDYKLNESTVAYVFEKKTTIAWRVNDNATDDND